MAGNGNRKGQMIKAIFWDNDGVLVDTEGLYFQANMDTFKYFGIETSPEEFIDYSLVKGKSLWEIAERSGLTRPEFEDFRIQRNALYESFISIGNLLKPGVEDVLENLNGNCLMGIVTSSSRADFNVIHSSTGILKYISFVLAGGEYEDYKPHPAPYLKALEMSGFRADECIVIEDSPRGLASAVAAGIRCIVIPDKMTASCDFSGAWKVVMDITDIPDILSLI
jgi:HAD superfamily hydrolase (TIGR01509 family)